MSSVLRMLQPPLLSKQRGCVAAWHAGGLPGPSLIGAQLRDFISNTHHAQFGSTSGSDSNDPLQLLPEGGHWYVYFPGSSGNSLTITLDANTAYDYTIVYSDESTDTDGQTSTGAGLLTFGGTDAKFAGLKVRRILIVPDGGGATVADIVLTDKDAYNATRTSLVARSGQTVTINRSSTGRKTSVVDRPLILFGTDDYLEVADHADLDFGAGDGFTVALAHRAYGTASQVWMAKKSAGGASNVGWVLYRGGSSLARFAIADGTTLIDDGGATLTEGLASVILGRRSVGPKNVAVVLNGDPGDATPDTTTATLANTQVLRIGQYSGGTVSADIEVFAAAVFRRALANYEIRQLNRELLGVPI